MGSERLGFCPGFDDYRTSEYFMQKLQEQQGKRSRNCNSGKNCNSKNYSAKIARVATLKTEGATVSPLLWGMQGGRSTTIVSQ